MERRLTAILAADVVGYSRLMGEDEVGTLERLKGCRRELIDPAIKEYHGRIIKLMGDGALVEFASVVDAVQCAAVIQRRMAERNEGTPDARQIRFRIGVNLGDVIVEGDDIYGDGVNIAARLEAMAEPGGICISGTAFDHAVHKVDVGLGEQRRLGSVSALETPKCGGNDRFGSAHDIGPWRYNVRYGARQISLRCVHLLNHREVEHLA